MYILAQHLIGRCSGEWGTKTAHAYNMLAANLHAQISQQTNTHTHTHVVEDVATLNNALWELKKGVLPRLDKSGFAGFRPTLRRFWVRFCCGDGRFPTPRCLFARGSTERCAKRASYPPWAPLLRAMSNLHVGTDLLAATSPLKYAV